jgi:uncharacterized membrane protein
MKRFADPSVVFLLMVLLISAGLFLVGQKQHSDRISVNARIIELQDDTELKGGWLKVGRQIITAKIGSGRFQGQTIRVDNHLAGDLLSDRYVSVDDQAVFNLSLKNGSISKARLVDYNRQRWHLFLFAAFAILLLIFARGTGLRAFASFVFTIAVLFKVLLPAILMGVDPLILSVGLSAVIATVTLLLVAGFSIRSLAAIIGVCCGMFLTAILTVSVGAGLKLDGMTSEYAITLLFSGQGHLDLDRIFWGAIILGASGAMVDVSIAVATAVEQVSLANPHSSAISLVRSGFEVGRAALGTMVTTLLLAYTGCSIFLLLLFQASGAHLSRFVNYNFVSAEILRTLCGSVGMIMVAPITAIIAGFLYHRSHRPLKNPVVRTDTSSLKAQKKRDSVKSVSRNTLWDALFASIVLISTLALLLSGWNRSSQEATAVRAEVIQVTDQTKQVGRIRMGRQEVIARIQQGSFKGQRVTVINHLAGHMLHDRYVKPGDKTLFMLQILNNRIMKAKLVDFDRLNSHWIMFIIFSALLILFAGKTGLKALISFFFTIAVIVRILLPAILNHHDPLLVCVGLAALIASVTLVLVGGFQLRTLAAIIGVWIGMSLTAVLTVLVGQGMQLQGITVDFATKLLFTGYAHLDFDSIFWGAVILSASGTLLDIAISISSTVAEVVKANPSLGVMKLVRSGFAVGQAELSTMVSTLLLAYTSYSLFLLLTLSARGISLERVLNLGAISALLLKILAGGIGMVMVAPVTALCAGLLYHRFHGSSE